MIESELELKFGISPMLDLEIDVAALGWVGLTPDVPHHVRTNVTAAVIAAQMGYESIDYVRKMRIAGLKPHTARDEGVRTLLASHVYGYDQFYRGFGGARHNEPIGVFAFDLAMVRARETLKLLLYTARQGFLLEPVLIARSLLEQFSYAVFVWDKTADADLFDVHPQSLLKHLVAVYPTAGRAYGALSKLAHYDPRQHFEFISAGDASVIQRSWKFKVYSLSLVFLLLDIKRRIFQHCYHDAKHFTELNSSLGEPTVVAFDRFFENVELDQIQSVRALMC